MSDEINCDRRRLFGSAAMTFAAAQLSLSATAEAQTALPKKPGTAAVGGGTNTSFASLRQIDAGLLNVGYVEAGPSGGQSPPQRAAQRKTICASDETEAAGRAFCSTPRVR